MTLDEKITRSIDTRMEEMAALFNDVDDACDCHRLLHKVQSALPLIQDIKTEVKSLEDWIKNQPLKPEEDDDKDEKDDDQPVYDPEIEDVLPEVLDTLKKGNRLRQKLRDSLPDPSQNNVPDLPGAARWILPVELAGLVAKLIEIARIDHELRDNLPNLFKKEGESIKDYMKRVQNEELKKTLELVEEEINAATADEIDNLNDLIERVIDAAIEELSSRIFQIGQQMGSCCSNLGEAVDDVDRGVEDVKREISLLEPAKTAGNELAILSKQGAILSEMQGIRGLL